MKKAFLGTSFESTQWIKHSLPKFFKSSIEYLPSPHPMSAMFFTDFPFWHKKSEYR
jgi:hypothetical protein